VRIDRPGRSGNKIQAVCALRGARALAVQSPGRNDRTLPPAKWGVRTGRAPGLWRHLDLASVSRPSSRGCQPVGELNRGVRSQEQEVRSERGTSVSSRDGALVFAGFVGAVANRVGLLGQLLEQNGRAAVRARLGDGLVPSGEFAIRIPAAPVERLAALGAAHDEFPRAILL